ncbi:hypothetical protein J3E68DRAFT_118060 [Trichoderma sp. SZMC 28012]
MFTLSHLEGTQKIISRHKCSPKSNSVMRLSSRTHISLVLARRISGCFFLDVLIVTLSCPVLSFPFRQAFLSNLNMCLLVLPLICFVPLSNA